MHKKESAEVENEFASRELATETDLGGREEPTRNLTRQKCQLYGDAMSNFLSPEDDGSFDICEKHPVCNTGPEDLESTGSSSDDDELDEYEWFDLDKHKEAHEKGTSKLIDESWLLDVSAELRCIAFDPSVEILEADCVNVLAQLAKRLATLVIFDPPLHCDATPYSLETSSRKCYREYVLECLNLSLKHLAPTGNLFVNVEEDIANEVVEQMEDKGLHLMSWFEWHPLPGPRQITSRDNSKMYCFNFAKSRTNRIWNPQDMPNIPNDFQAATERESDLAVPSAPPSKQVPPDYWGLPSDGSNRELIQDNAIERGLALSNQLPMICIERIVQASTNKGSLVLAPFLGHGTACTVSQMLGRRSVGLEADPERVRHACERVMLVAMQAKKPFIPCMSQTTSYRDVPSRK